MINKVKKIQLLSMAAEIGVKIDRWDNIKWILNSGKEVRYKFMANVVRVEYKNPDNSKWRRLNSTKISKISFDKWNMTMKTVYKEQNKA